MPTKILVADDSATMRRVLEMTFAGEDATVTTVDTAEAALAKAAELSPDLIFADASLSGVDGYELAKRIKADPRLSKIAVVVMASQQAPYDDARGRASSVDDHISKPFDTQSVIDRVGQVLSRQRSSSSTAEAKPVAAPAARPAPPAPVAAAANAASAAPRVPQGTRMGVGAVPLQPSAAKSAVAAPIPALRPQGAPPLAAPAAAAKPMAPPPAAAARPAPAAVAAATQELGGKLAALGLTREQIEGVLALSREVVEQVVWEVVPELAETLIKEEIKRLTAE